MRNLYLPKHLHPLNSKWQFMTGNAKMASNTLAKSGLSMRKKAAKYRFWHLFFDKSGKNNRFEYGLMYLIISPLWSRTAPKGKSNRTRIETSRR